jgi:hypothetical protein
MNTLHPRSEYVDGSEPVLWWFCENGEFHRKPYALDYVPLDPRWTHFSRIPDPSEMTMA